jgi:hypothetical protein
MISARFDRLVARQRGTPPWRRDRRVDLVDRRERDHARLLTERGVVDGPVRPEVDSTTRPSIQCWM